MENSKPNTKENIFNIPDYKGCGVYAIVNAEDFKAYVGSSRNIKKRAIEHLTTLNQGKHRNKKLQADTGKDLRFIILHKCNSVFEEKWLRYLETIYMVTMRRNYFDLYNVSNAGKGDIDEICYKLVCDISYDFETNKHLNDSIKEEYGVATGFLHARKPKNRNKRNISIPALMKN